MFRSSLSDPSVSVRGWRLLPLVTALLWAPGCPTTVVDDDDDDDSARQNDALRCDDWDEADFPEQPATFELRDGVALMYGVIDESTPAALAAFQAAHPEVDTLVMPFVPGSMDDIANLQAARAFHASGWATCLPARGLIASGGVDFFLAGARRAVGEGGLVGVHSWGDGAGLSGADLPRDDPEHRRYLDYYEEIGIDPEFYWFTLEAAPPEDVHWMSEAELARYGIEQE